MAGETMFLIFVVVLILFGVLFVRSVRAGYGRVLFWLVYFLAGGAAVLSITEPPSLLEKIFANLWAWSVVCLPVWWLILWVRSVRHGR